jgi:hypothetical protein
MSTVGTTSSFRRIVGGLSVIAAPLLFSFVEITYPAHGETPARALANGAAQSGLWLADIYLGLAADILFVIAAFALLAVIQQRGAALAVAAAALTVIGSCLAAATGGLHWMEWAMAQPGVDRATALGVLSQALQNPAGAPVAFGHWFLRALGVALFGVAVWRSGFGYRWAGLVATLGIVIDTLAGFLPVEQIPTIDLAVSLVTDGLLVAGLAAVGWRILRPAASASLQPARTAGDRPPGMAARA